MTRALGSLVLVVVLHAVVLGTSWLLSGGLLWAGWPLLFLTAVGIMAAQWLVFIPSAILQTEKVYDLTGGLTYVLSTVGVLLATWVLDEMHLRSIIMGSFVVVWAVRLSGFLFLRIHRAGKDGRFDNIKRNPMAFLVAWSLQGTWVFFAALPVFVVMSSSQYQPLGPWVLLGAALWGIGFAIEVTADRQKSAFNTKPENVGRWIDVGLWRFSQHPNYFGEIVLWTGVLVSGLGVYQGLQWFVCLSPLLITILLTRVSGIPMLDARAIEKWGEEKQYLAYRRNTSVLIPWFRKRDD